MKVPILDDSTNQPPRTCEMPNFFPNLRESRRMERQDTRTPSGTASAINISSRLEGRTDSKLKHTHDLSGRLAAVDASDSTAILGAAGSVERDGVSRGALEILLPSGMERDALRKMRVLLEEDERKRKRGDGGEGRGDGAEESSRRKKKNRKKEKKSSSKRKRRNSSRHRKRDRKERSGGNGRYDSSSSSSSSSSSGGGSSSAGEADVRSSSSKKKKKRHHKHKKRSSVGSRSGERGRGLRGVVSASLSATGGEDSGADEAHPILQRKKHSLWG